MLRYTPGEKDASFSPIANRGVLALPTGPLSFGKMSSEPSLFGISKITVRTEVSPARKLFYAATVFAFC